MTFLLVPWQHPFAATFRSRRRTCFIPASASAGRAPRTSSQSAHRIRRQPPVLNHQRLSALSYGNKTISRQRRCRTKSHRRSGAHRFPAGSFFGGFRTPALYRVDRSCSGRHPKPFPIPDACRDRLPLGSRPHIGPSRRRAHHRRCANTRHRVIGFDPSRMGDYRGSPIIGRKAGAKAQSTSARIVKGRPCNPGNRTSRPAGR